MLSTVNLTLLIRLVAISYSSFFFSRSTRHSQSLPTTNTLGRKSSDSNVSMASTTIFKKRVEAASNIAMQSECSAL